MSRMPQVTSRELVRFFRRQGFVEQRQRGSHLTLRHPGPPVRIAVVPMHRGRDLPSPTAESILKQAGYTVEDYLRLR